jgi:hypothetical protein
MPCLLAGFAAHWYIIHHMSSLNQIYHGSSKAGDTIIRLRAGKVSLFFCNATIRRVMVDDVEIVRRIYIAVRDDIWNTIAYSISRLRIASDKSSFLVEFDCRHRKGVVDFLWHGSICGTSDSTIRFSMQGQALSSFKSNRIGFCVLHPLSECLGKPCTVITTRGEKIITRFPRFISPDQPFKNMRGIIQKIEGIESRITFKGDTFEMEDQRNWTDASFKTYCPPRSRPYPFAVKKGDCFSQSIEITVAGKPKPCSRTHETTTQVASVDTHFRPLTIPEIGCIFRLHQTAAGLRLARLLGLSHIRIDVTVSQSGIAAALRGVKGISTDLDSPLEMALYFSEKPIKKQITLVRDMLAGCALPIKRFLVFRHGEKVTAAATMLEVLPALRMTAPAVDIVTGTNFYFVEINKALPELRDIDGICYSVNPQVHTFDDQGILENLEGQVYPVQSAQRLGRGMPVYVTPITLRPRLNPDMPKKFHGPDVRQKSLFGAVWTLGSIIRLGQAGARGATYFELTGPCGVMEQGGTRVFPLFHVLADVNEFSGGTMRLLSCGKRSGITGCLLEKEGRKRWLIANMSMEKKEIVLSGLPGKVLEKHLDETTFPKACNRPEKFRRKEGRQVRPASGMLKIKLLPYGIIRLDERF